MTWMLVLLVAAVGAIGAYCAGWNDGYSKGYLDGSECVEPVVYRKEKSDEKH